MLTISSLIAWTLTPAFALFFLRAVTMFAAVQKMPQTAERMNMRDRANANVTHALLCILLSFGLRIAEHASSLSPLPKILINSGTNPFLARWLHRTSGKFQISSE
jgi:hypothetical protein